METLNPKNGNGHSTATQQAASTALAIVPRSLEDVGRLVKSIIGSTLLPDALRREPDVQMAVMTGLELGLTPMMAIRGICVIKGKPTLYAATMVAVVLGRGVAEYFECIEDKGDSVTYETKRIGGRNPQRATWTMADAKRANLGGDNWTKFPSDMLHARCMSRLARRVYPDVLAGIYTPDEIEHPSEPITQEQRVDAIDAEFVEVPADAPAGPSLLDRIAEAPSLDALKAFAPECNKLPKGSSERASAIDAYKKREAWLKEQPAAEVA